MPILSICTSLPAASIPDEFPIAMTDILCQTLEKPKQYTLVHVLADQTISFGGTLEPTALCELTMVGKTDKDLNDQRCEALTAALNEQLNIPADRIFFTFTSLPGFSCGHNKKTFASMG